MKRRLARQQKVYEVAKELGVKSKAIVEKCQDEGFSEVANHMTPISPPLEALIKHWFKQHETD